MTARAPSTADWADGRLDGYGGRFEIGGDGDAGPSLDTIDHFVVMVGQILDGALIGRVLVRLTLRDGGVVEGVPVAPASTVSPDDELGDSGYRRWITIAGTSVDLSDVREAAIVYPAPMG